LVYLYPLLLKHVRKCKSRGCNSCRSVDSEAVDSGGAGRPRNEQREHCHVSSHQPMPMIHEDQEELRWQESSPHSSSNSPLDDRFLNLRLFASWAISSLWESQTDFSVAEADLPSPEKRWEEKNGTDSASKGVAIKDGVLDLPKRDQSEGPFCSAVGYGQNSHDLYDSPVSPLRPHRNVSVDAENPEGNKQCTSFDSPPIRPARFVSEELPTDSQLG